MGDEFSDHSEGHVVKGNVRHNPVEGMVGMQVKIGF